MQSVKKIVIVGILLAVAVGLAYPIAVSALSIAAQRFNSSSIATAQSQQARGDGDVDREYLTVSEFRSWGGREDRGGHRGYAIAIPKIVLSALVNITSSDVQNVTTKDLAKVVLIKKEGNYSVLLLVKARSSKQVYHAMISVTGLNIGTDKISIDGNITRSNLPGFVNGSSAYIEVFIGSATISSGGSQISGSILSLIYRKYVETN